MTYSIKITGSKYNEDYTFTDPAEGSIKEEVAAILDERQDIVLNRRVKVVQSKTHVQRLHSATDQQGYL